GHPLEGYEEELKKQGTVSILDILNMNQNSESRVQNSEFGLPNIDFPSAVIQQTESNDLNCQLSTVSRQHSLSDGQVITIGGIITDKKTKITKSNNLMAFIRVEDAFGGIEVLVFPTILDKYAKFIEIENIVTIRGRLSIKEDEEPKLICEEISPLIKTQTKKLYLKACKSLNNNTLEAVYALLRYFNGLTPVYIFFEDEEVTKIAGKDMWITPHEELIEELKSILGSDCVKMVVS
ncbi:MAG: OB-fold nucleic acid binding domain-containing protein, partial [Ignavibacteriales bacterium]